MLSPIVLGRFATYVVPALSVAVTAAVLIGPGATRKAAFVRVYGAPVRGSNSLALRLEGLERLYGVDERVALRDLEVEVHDGNKTLGPVQLSLDADCTSEVWFETPNHLEGPVDLRVRQGQTSLAVGEIIVAAPREERSVLAPIELAGTTSGNLLVSVAVRRGKLAAPFQESLDVRVGLAPHVSPTNQGFGGIDLNASAPGAIVSPEKFVTDEQGRATIRITPQAHHIKLSIEAKSDAHGEGRWENVLPVIPGATWLDPNTKNGLDFVSPTARERLYLSLLGEHGRTSGMVLPVSKDEQGFYRGHFDIGPKLRADATQVVVASDPQEQGPATVVWPLEEGRQVVAVPTIQKLLDGAEIAVVREELRASRVRKLALLVVIAATIFEVLFMIAKSRASQRKLEENLGRMVEGHESERAQIEAVGREQSPVLRNALAFSLVLLGFSMLAALSTLTH